MQDLNAMTKYSLNARDVNESYALKVKVLLNGAAAQGRKKVEGERGGRGIG